MTGGRAGSITLQYAVADAVAEYTTINITCATLGFPTDRPARVRRVMVEFSCVPDSQAVQPKAHPPILQFNVFAPSGSSTPRCLFRTPPHLVPLGPVKVFRYKIPDAGYFVYDASSTIVLQMIVSGSAGLSVAANIFVTADLDYRPYQGLDGFEALPHTIQH